MNKQARKLFNMILAIVISIGGWTYVVYNYYPNTDVRYNGIPITFSGMDSLADRGLGITKTSKDSINVLLNQKRISMGKITVDDIYVTADVSEAIEGENGISLRIVGPEGTVIRESDTNIITVTVDKVKTAKVKVFVEYDDSTDQGLEPIATELSDEYVTVVGAKSEIGYVDRVIAYISMSEITDSSRNFTRELVAVDKNNRVLNHVITYPDIISFQAEAGFVKPVRLNAVIIGEDENGYVRTVTAPDSILIKGRQDAVLPITKIYTNTINLSGIFEDTEIPLTYDLPEGVYLANEGLGNTIKIKVERSDSKDENKN